MRCALAPIQTFSSRTISCPNHGIMWLLMIGVLPALQRSRFQGCQAHRASLPTRTISNGMESYGSQSMVLLSQVVLEHLMSMRWHSSIQESGRSSMDQSPQTWPCN
jgi:hypothetical protein